MAYLVVYFYMGKIFKNKPRGQGQRGHQPHRGPKTNEKVDLMDPVLYLGGLDLEKYPVLPTQNEENEEEEIENPLNKR